MTKIEVRETELIWPSKYDEKGERKETEQIDLPFQVIETINESRATRDARKRGKQLSLYDMWFKKEGDTFQEGWKNKIIWGENKLVMSSLVKDFAGKVDLIYIDPPFATGADFRFSNRIGENGLEFVKEQSLIEEKVYRDTWGKGLSSYLQMMYERLVLMKKLLSSAGTIYVHLDWRVGHHLRVLMDEIFGPECHLNTITWRRQIPRGMKAWAKYYGNSTDCLLMYSRDPDKAKWNRPVHEELISIEEARSKYMEDERGFFRTSDPGTYTDESLIQLYKEGRIYVTKGGEFVIHEDGSVGTTKGTIGVKYYRERRGDRIVEEKPVDNLWSNIPGMGITPQEYLGFPTQKVEALLHRIIEASSDIGDLVADFFCGSGTTLAVAEKLNRRWIGCDLSRWAIHITRKRLLGISNCKPFELLNLGKYERKYWQTITFGKTKKHDEQLTIFEYLKFILKLYDAEPLSGMQHLHGRKGGVVIHIGAVDAPVTIDEINACLDECEAVNQRQLHILGWEWEMGLYDLISEAAKGRGIKLVLLTIPREVMEKKAVERGDIQFYELAYLEADIIQQKNRKVVVEIKDFVIPNYELLSEEIRGKVKKWSDYIDYWAVDWNFQNDTFMNGWVTYRTRRDRKLPLKSDPHKYEKPGKYTIMVKVVDVFGNDTSQAFEVEVK